MDRTRAYSIKGDLPMSNSSRIETATRSHVGATLTSEQIVELVRVSDPTNTKGVYPSDVAYTQTDEGLKPRGATAYGDGVLIYLGPNSFKVLPTNEIIRRPQSKKPAVAVAPAAVAAAPAQKEAAKKPAATAQGKKAKKASGAASQIPVATKSRANQPRI
jgi:hypothetical protein